MQPVPRQRIGKRASTTIELLLETVYSTRSVQSGYKEENWGNQFIWSLQGRLRRAGGIVSCQLRAEFCTGVWARELEESPLMEAFGRKRLLNTLQAGEDRVVIWELWRSGIAL
jgi:hypothetical protein